jgi:hypothetical protein
MPNPSTPTSSDSHSDAMAHLLLISGHVIERLEDVGFVDLQLDSYLVERFRHALRAATSDSNGENEAGGGGNAHQDAVD